MSFFKRDKNKKMQSSPMKADSSNARGEESPAKSDFDRTPRDQPPHRPRETSPQRVGIVSGVLTTTATSEEEFSGSGIVDRHFGPNGKLHRPNSKAGEVDHADKTDKTGNAEKAASDNKKEGAEMKKSPSDLPPRREHLRAVETYPGEDLAGEDLESLKLEIDPMAHIGHATTITGNIVAEEDLEVQGTIEGAIRLANHQLTVGKDGHAKASVEAHTVLVVGRISGDVVASELIEIKPGGIIGGDVKAPRIIMHDGGIVVGGMDMSSSLPSSAELAKPEPSMPERPKLKSVESPRISFIEAEELK